MRKTWIFDCDNTLYSGETGFFNRVDDRIRAYMAVRLGIPEEKIEPLRIGYREAFGVTLVGLMRDYAITPEDYLTYVHDVELDDLINRDEGLSVALKSLEGEIHIMTNGTRSHAGRVLERLGIADRISTVFDIGFMDYIPKPNPHGYLKMLASLGVAASSCIMVDDMEVNLDTARTLGMETVLVGRASSGGHKLAQGVGDIPGLLLSLR